MSLPFSITLAQINPAVGDLIGNAEQIRTAWKAAENAGCDLIIFPEMIITGYPCDDLLTHSAFVTAAQQSLKDLVHFSKGRKTSAILTAPHPENGRLYNACYFVEDGAIRHQVFKHILPNTGVFDEARYFSSGPLPDIFHWRGQRLGLIICEDIWHPTVTDHYAKAGVDLLISPNGSPFQTDKVSRRLEQARARVQTAQCPLIYVNHWGGQDDLLFDGQSFVMDQTGKIIHQLPAYQDCLYHTHQPQVFPAPDMMEILYRGMTTGLRDYIRKNGFSGVLLGLSGGIDSALVAAIATDALGADIVDGVMLPSPFTSKESLEDAAACAAALGISLQTIPIDPAMMAYESMLSHALDPVTQSVAYENIQSRIRGATLMALSNASGKLLLTTGNKSELAVGYATLYGDMCGAYNPIKDLYKTMVYKISHWRNAQSPVIPDRILTKAPSAELKPNQTDQDTLPPYDILDDILEHLIEKDCTLDQIPHDRALVEKIAFMLKRAEYKRHQAAPGPKLTSKAFGRDRRYPITNGT